MRKNDTRQASIQLNLDKVDPAAKITAVRQVNDGVSMTNNDRWNVALPPYGIAVYSIDYR